MRIATWNLKQAVAPKKDLQTLWTWASEEIQPDVIVFTEAKVPKDYESYGWTAQWNPEGIHPEKKQRWGTVIASSSVDLVPVTHVKRGLRQIPLEFHWPAAVQISDIMVEGERWATIVGMYAPGWDLRGNKTGHGHDSLNYLLDQLRPLIDSSRGDRLLIAGDFNLWPVDVQRYFRNLDFVDLIEHTAPNRAPLPQCANCDFLAENGRKHVNRCGHLWTHRNGNSPNAKRQQIDYIYSSPALAEELIGLKGGVADFPDAWDVSDHAPVVADFHT